MLAHVRNDAEGALSVVVELRRDADAVLATGPCRLRWRSDNADWSVREWHPDPTCVTCCELPLPADRSVLGWLRGSVELELTLFGRAMTLREPFSWDGRTVKDWMVLGPQEPGEAPEAPANLDELRRRRDPAGADGRPRGWKAHRFNPSRVARDVRHFYNLGDVFLCKGGSCSAVAQVDAEQGGPAEFEFYHDGKARLWLNGVELDLSRGHRQAVTLKNGSNLFWVRLSEVTRQGRGFHLAMHSTDGGARGLSFCLPDGVALPE